jgi:uncharacterized protein (TIGR03118 family)
MAFVKVARMGSIAITSVLFAAGCMASEGKGSQVEIGNGSSSNDTTGVSGAGSGSAVVNAMAVINLTSDQAKIATNSAAAMVNAWGIIGFQGMFWIADAGTGKISIVDGKGVPSTGKLASDTIDLGEGITGIAATGLPVDDMTALQIHGASTCGPAQLIVASEDGKLFGINVGLSTTSGFLLMDRSGSAASYKGVAVVQGKSGPLVLAADFHNGRIDVFDANFGFVTDVSFAVPSLPAGFAPFNVMASGNTVYVAYAMQDADKADEVQGAGLGLIAAFDTSGKLLATLKSDSFNAPWGMAMSRDFAAFPNALLVGNFGDGHITAVAPVDPTGLTRNMTVLGQLVDATGAPLMIDGLWGLAFGADVTNARPDAVYFAAGPDDEMHGMFGAIAPAAPATP